MMKPALFSLRARYLLPIDRPPLHNAWITIADGKIAAIDSAPSGEATDLGDVAILPGLVNAHTHLEFSSLAAPLGEPGMPFTDWIRHVIQWRGEQGVDGLDWRIRAIKAGIAESTRSGVTTCGEIATLPLDSGLAAYDDFCGLVFLELLGLAPDREADLLQAARTFVDQAGTRTRSFAAGLSPHGPYTVSPRLLEQIVENSNALLAMHIAETREELELLRSASGPLVELLTGLGAWYPDALPRGLRPMDYLAQLAKAQRALVIHGNYLEEDEFAFLSRHRDRMSVIYCPRTHTYFEHPDYPLRRMLQAGVNVALGTDSRASTADLDMLTEVRFAAQKHSDIAPESILPMATINAAHALGLGERIGSLTVGKKADIIVVPVDKSDANNPTELILASEQHASRVYRAGKLVCSAD